MDAASQIVGLAYSRPDTENRYILQNVIDEYDSDGGKEPTPVKKDAYMQHSEMLVIKQPEIPILDMDTKKKKKPLRSHTLVRKRPSNSDISDTSGRNKTKRSL